MQADDRPLEQQLLAEAPAELAAEALAAGDPSRGAILFHQPYMQCSKCHATGDQASPLGPDLAKFADPVSGAQLVESVLRPSAAIREGYQPLTVLTDSGQALHGIMVEDRAEELVLREMSGDDRLIRIERDRIEQISPGAASVMPSGLVSQLSNRQQFLDLVAFLMEIAEHGPQRALELRPAEALIAALEIPEYEGRVDHAGLIEDLNTEALERGRAIYHRLCANCHGTAEEAGSMPTSLRFASGTFKNGSDPYSLYQTLTRGFGLMPAQTWMVPQQKYDVIHFIRETYLKPQNPSQYVVADRSYLTSLPKGDTRGPQPTAFEPWITMDYGPSLIQTYETGRGGENIAQKGIAVRLDSGPGGVSRGQRWMLWDHDTLRMAAAWSGTEFIDWQGIQFDGRHGAHPHVIGQIATGNENGPGWANPITGSFEDPRLIGRDGKRYGPLPREWGQYRGLYHFGDQVVIAYTVGGAAILEQPGSEIPADDPHQPIFTRTLNIGASAHDLIARIAPDSSEIGVAVGLDPANGKAAKLRVEAGYHVLRVAAEQTPLAVTIYIGRGGRQRVEAHAAESAPPARLERFTHGGPARWPQRIPTAAVLSAESAPLVVDVLTHPGNNPWHCQMRLTGLDFFADADRAAVCSWDGDVWLVEGLAGLAAADAQNRSAVLTWQRIASGLFQPLGLKIIDDRIFVTCRDQIAVLHDLNGDGETDFYENFNNDHQVTEHFHEFAMGLQTDAEGNLYYAKSARHAKPAVVPHHGTLLRVSKDGQRTDIVATGFRAANGVCLNPDGTFFVTDQEGHWIPKNRINWVREGRYYGNAFGYHDVTDTSDDAMEPPLCWITNAFDRSPAELIWVDSDRWGPLDGSLLNLSYGYGKVYVVPHERIGDQMQGGMVELPLPQFPTGLIRGRFHPADGQLYVCGMHAWAGSRTQPGGLYRIRATGNPVHVPVGLGAKTSSLEIEFSEPLAPEAAADTSRWAAKVWSLRRTENYGSEHFDEHSVSIESVRVSDDARTVTLVIPELAPTWCMEIKYTLEASDGQPVVGTIHNTIHELHE